MFTVCCLIESGVEPERLVHRSRRPGKANSFPSFTSQQSGCPTASADTQDFSFDEICRHTVEAIDCAKPATREALFRRLLLSADFIQSHFAEPLNVDLLAAVSNLSPFHFARLFSLVMDETPHAFLTRKRVAVARRLIDAGLCRGDAAERAGFGCRSTLFRHLRGAAIVRS